MMAEIIPTVWARLPLPRRAVALNEREDRKISQSNVIDRRKIKFALVQERISETVQQEQRKIAKLKSAQRRQTVLACDKWFKIEVLTSKKLVQSDLT
jgi:hypothetical protein